MKGSPMNTPQEERDDTSLPGRFHNGDRFEIAGDTMTRTQGRWPCSCGQTHDDEQVQVDLDDGNGVLVTAPNVPVAAPAGEALVQQIAEALRRSPNGVWMTLPGLTDIAPSFARAVLPLVEAQVAPLRDEVVKWRLFAHGESVRAEAAEALVDLYRAEWVGTRQLPDCTCGGISACLACQSADGLADRS
jgi:hypothetical protein